MRIDQMNARRDAIGPSPFFSSLVAYTSADKWLYLVIAAYSVAGSLFLLHFGLFSWASFGIYPGKWFFLFAIFMPAMAVLWDAACIIHRFDRRRALVFRRVYSRERLAYMAAGILCLLALSVFQSVFTAVKTAFPLIEGGFPYDATHAALDRLLHFNTDPWRILQPFLGYDLVRSIIEWNYNALWFVICFAVLFFMMTSPKAAGMRTRYFLCFCLVWTVIGTLLAGFFLSAGPAYYGLVTGDADRFRDQLVFLARSGEQAHSAVAYQHYLWTVYSQRSLGFGSGISAFPSVHVGLITLTALFLAELNRKLAIPLAAYVGFVMISSVYLGWHYAIDGYVSAAVTLLIYAGVNKASTVIGRRRWHKDHGPTLDDASTAPAP
ncbi:phosphatase PAP2 family protein [Tianweitania sp. BSSL-BM11]|uniref:Phosphatase PAP2 family protein n=1 Tax=Tianweitania aestuarii TaxID=2814886 RepID=A0ABS5RX97_9HYPH|nr:phosphatase PAP2 family protein [Tianweitania aestuarii]MBS9721663.1 phosphatase PAP2 family protein [Tianweitania aestuarii]